MSDKIIQPCNPVIGVARGQVATLDLQIGPRYHALWLEITASSANSQLLKLSDIIGLINIKINGKVQRAHTATELDQIQNSYGNPLQANGYRYSAGALSWTAQTSIGTRSPAITGGTSGTATNGDAIWLLPIFFCEPWRKSYAAVDMMAWFTAWQDGSVLRSFQVEIEVLSEATIADTAKAVTINAFAETDSVVGPINNGQPLALINKWKRHTIPYTGTGELYITTLEKRQVCNQISLFSPPIVSDDTVYDTVGAIKIVRDNAIIRDVTRLRNDQSLLARGFYEAGLPPGRFDVVFDYSDSPLDGLLLEGARDFKVIPNMTFVGDHSAKYLTLISQIYGGID